MNKNIKYNIFKNMFSIVKYQSWANYYYTEKEMITLLITFTKNVVRNPRFFLSVYLTNT